MMIEMDFNEQSEFKKKYVLLNKDRLHHAVTCDIDIMVIEGNQAHIRTCHKEVLSDSFEYFERRFQNRSTTVSPARARVIQGAPFTNLKILEKLLHLAYTGKLSFFKSDAFDVLHDCVMFRFKYAAQIWQRIFNRDFFRSRVLDFFILYQQYNRKSSGWYDTLHYIATHFDDLSQKEQLLAASAEELKHVMRYLPPMVAGGNERVLDFVVRWAQVDHDERKHSISAVLKNINVNNVSGAFAKDLTVKLFESEHFYDSEWAKKFVADDETRTLKTFVHMKRGIHYYFLEYELCKSSGDWQYASAEFVQRLSMSKFVIVGDRIYNFRSIPEDTEGKMYTYSFRSTLVDRYKSLFKVESTDLERSKVPYMKSLIRTFQIGVIGAKIYMYTCAADINTDNHLMCYNCETNQWTRVLANREPITSRSVMVTYNNVVYLLGGLQFKNRTHLEKGRAICYDDRVKQWVKLQDMRHTHSYGAACSFDGRIYVAGGRDYAGEVMNAVEVFDQVAAKWDLLSPLNIKRDFFALVPFNNSLWAIGREFSLITEVYHPPDNCWSIYEKSMVRARGDRLLVDLWKPQYRHTDYDDTVPAFVLDAITL